MAITNVGTVFMDLELSNQNAFNRDVKNTAKTAENAFTSSFEVIKSQVTKALSVVALISFGKASVKAASQAQSAWTGLNSIIQGQGRNFNEAKEYIQDYVKDGLVPLNNAVGAYKNLLLRGYDDSQIKSIMTAFKDSAAFSRQASYSMGDAIETATEGLKNENSVVVDNVGVTKNVAKMWEEYARTIGKTTNNLTMAEKRQAEFTGIMRETAFQTGDATAYMNTFAGKTAMLSSAFISLKTAVGSVIAPIVGAFIPVIIQAINAVTWLFNKLGSLLAIFGLKMPMVIDKGTAAMSGFASQSNGAEKAMDGAGKQAKKTAKEINRAFASVDELNVLQTPDDASSGGGGGGGAPSGGGGIEAPFSTMKTPNIVDAIDPQLEKLMKSFEKFKKVVLDSFTWDSIVKSTKKVIDTVFKNVNSIFSNLKKIFGSLGKGFKEAIISNSSDIDKAIASLMKGAGDIISSGINLLLAPIDGYYEGIAKTVEKRAPEIAEGLVGIFTKVHGFIGEALSSVSEPIDILAEGIKETFVLVGELIVTVIADIIETLDSNLAFIILPLRGIADSFISIFNAMAITVTTGWVAFLEGLKRVWNESGKSIIDGALNFVFSLLEILQKLWTDIMEPIIIPFLADFKQLWVDTLQPTIEEMQRFVMKMVDLALVVWNRVISPLINWVVEKLGPPIVTIINLVKDVFMENLKIIFDAIKLLFSVLNGIIDFLKNVYTNNWSAAWQQVVNLFKTIVSGIGNIFKAPLNTIIQGINSFIDGLNRVKVPDWVPTVGGKGINIPKIPMLAQGGWVPPNNPRLAIIGDNKREGEIVAPESKIEKAVAEGINKAREGINGLKELMLEVHITTDDGRKVIKKINDVQRQEGRILLEV